MRKKTLYAQPGKDERAGKSYSKPVKVVGIVRNPRTCGICGVPLKHGQTQFCSVKHSGKARRKEGKKHADRRKKRREK